MEGVYLVVNDFAKILLAVSYNVVTIECKKGIYIILKVVANTYLASALVLDLFESSQ